MRYLAFVGNLLAIAAVAFFLYLSYMDRQIFMQAQLNSTSILVVVLSVLAYMTAMFFGSLSWYILLRSVQEKVALVSVLAIYFVSQAAKYVPGNVAHHVGRVVMAKRYGIRTVNTLFTMFIETILIIGVASLLAIATLFDTGGIVFEGIPDSPRLLVLTSLVLFLLIAPIFGHRAFEWGVNWWSRRKNTNCQSVPFPSLRAIWKSLFLGVCTFLIIGMVMRFIIFGIFGIDLGDVFLLSGVFAVAWVAGFIAPGAPAGLGIRELVLVAALTPLYGNEVAIGVSAILRLVTVLGDGGTFLIGISLPLFFSSAKPAYG